MEDAVWKDPDVETLSTFLECLCFDWYRGWSHDRLLRGNKPHAYLSSLFLWSLIFKRNDTLCPCWSCHGDLQWSCSIWRGQATLHPSCKKHVHRAALSQVSTKDYQCPTCTCGCCCAPVFGLRTGGGGTWVSFAGYVPLAFQNPLPHYSLFCGQL